MIKNLEIVNYQRNGNQGDGFFVACFTEGKIRFAATFELNETNTWINPATCRVIDRDDLRTSWRGDDYADKINKVLKDRRQTVNNACQSWEAIAA